MYYSTTPRDDGFGSQLQNIIWDILFVKEFLHGEYVLTIPTKMEHNYNNKRNFIEELFDFMNLRKLVRLNSEIDGPLIYLNILDSYPIIQENFTTILNSDTMEIIRDTFLSDKVNVYNPKYFNIAIHIRYFNPHDSREIFIKDEKYYKLYQFLRSKYTDENVRFHIYSQGSLNEFEAYKSENTIFHLNESIQETFLGFVYADVLTITSSSLSYLAAHFRKNKVYAFKFWHSLSKDWEVIE